MGFKLIWNTATEPAPYLLRPPGNPPLNPTPPELAIEVVTTPEALLEFDRASYEGYGSKGEYIPNGWYQTDSLYDPNLTFIVGRIDGKIERIFNSVASTAV